MTPPVIILGCDWGAEWPTWVPAPNEPPESGRTAYFPLDEDAVSESLRVDLTAWHGRWERIVGPSEVQRAVDGDQWAAFVSEGRALAVWLQHELGPGVEVRVQL